VAELQKLFFDTWSRQNGPKLPERNYYPRMTEEGNALVQVLGSKPGADNRITFIAYVSAITFAENFIHLTNAYFIPDDQILKSLTDAAGRGVDVKIILPGTTDSTLALNAARYNYSRLLAAGIQIYERRTALLHAKTAVIDNVWSTVGSTNLDYWSLLSNDEGERGHSEPSVRPGNGENICQGSCRVPADKIGRVGRKALVRKDNGMVCPFV
jgi:cardiolipin synthase A/B